MGEKIRTIATGKILESEFEIELNHPTLKGLDQHIHIQSDKFRIEMEKKDFIKYGLSVLVAERNLKTIKEIE